MKLKKSTRYLVVKVEVEHEAGLSDDGIIELCEEVEVTVDNENGSITKSQVVDVLALPPHIPTGD